MFKISEELAIQESEQISEELPKQESEQIYKSFGVIDNNKCLLEGGEDPAAGEQVSDELPRQACKWMNNNFSVIDNKQHPLADREYPATRKTTKPLELRGKEETMKGLHYFSLAQIKQPDDQNHGDYHSESNPLIYQLGRDISINCLVHCSRSDYGAIATLNKAFRSLVRSGELYRLRRGMGITEHWVYFSCNLLEWESFDPIRHRWMHLPRMTSNECFMCSDKESLAVGTELLVFGKEISSHVIYRYSILTNTWSSGMSMNEGRCLFGSASLGDIAILAGGCDSCGNILSSAELYNSLTGAWVTIPNMHKPRKMCSAVFMDGKFYIVGGIGTETPNVLSCGEVYDLKTKTWTVIPNMCPPRNRPAGITTSAGSEAPPLIAVVKNELYAADYAQQEVKKYDKRKNVWNSIGRLPERADSMNGWGIAFKSCGEMLIVVGGPRNFGGGMIELNVWVPGEGPPEWNLIAAKPSASFVYNCAVMGC